MSRLIDFEISTPTLTLTGKLEHRDGQWRVADVDRRIRSLIGVTAEEIQSFCAGQNWKIKTIGA